MQTSTIPNSPSNAALPLTIADALTDLGGISAERLRLSPSYGLATEKEFADVHAQGVMCELVDGLLVEKVMGFKESLLAAVLIELLSRYVRQHHLGMVSGADGFLTMFPGLVRGPDVAFISWARLG